MGCVFSIINGKFNGQYPKDVWFKCTGVKGMKCDGKFQMRYDPITKKYKLYRPTIYHTGHKPLTLD